MRSVLWVLSLNRESRRSSPTFTLHPMQSEGGNDPRGRAIYRDNILNGMMAKEGNLGLRIIGLESRTS